jgi:short-subunit dehydrogenase
MKRSPEDMVVIITGASAGIGRALAVELAGRGAKLALAARRIDRIEELNRQLGGHHLCIATDVASREQCETLVARTIESYGRIDTLVCNAGYGFLAAVAKSTPEQMQAIFQTNVFGSVDCIRAAVPQMQKQELRDGWRGQIILVSSAVARRGLPYFGAYSATKAAQLSLAEAMRIELRPEKIAVTSIHPGGTKTEFGEVSATNSAGKRPERITGELSQSAEVVAGKIVSAIEKPTAEVWPIGAYRWATGIGGLFPALVDKLMARRAVQIGGDSSTPV